MSVAACNGLTASSDADEDPRILDLQLRFRQSQFRLRQLKQLPELSALLGADTSDSIDPLCVEHCLQVPQSKNSRTDSTGETFERETTVRETDSCDAICTFKKTAELFKVSSSNWEKNTAKRYVIPDSVLSSSRCAGIPFTTSVLKTPASHETDVSTSSRILAKIKTEESEPENAAAYIRIVSVESLNPNYKNTVTSGDVATSTVPQSSAPFYNGRTLKAVSAVNSTIVSSNAVYCSAVSSSICSTSTRAMVPTSQLLSQQFRQVLPSPLVSSSPISRPMYVARFGNSSGKTSKFTISSAGRHVLNLKGRSLAFRKRQQSAGKTVSGISYYMLYPRESRDAWEPPTKCAD